MYAAFLARSLKPTSVQQYVGTIGLLHTELGLENPLTDNYFVKSLFRRIKWVREILRFKSCLLLWIFYLLFLR